MTRKPCLSRKRTISSPVGRGSLATTQLGKIPAHLPKRRRTDPGQGVFEAERFNVPLQGFLQVGKRLLFGLPLPVSRDVWNPGGKPAQVRVGDNLDSHLRHVLIPPLTPRGSRYP